MEKELYGELELYLSKANQSCWTIRQILTLRVDDINELTALLDLEKQRFINSMDEIDRLYKILNQTFLITSK